MSAFGWLPRSAVREQHFALNRSKAKSDRAENDFELCVKSILNDTRDNRLLRVIELGPAALLVDAPLRWVFPHTHNTAYRSSPEVRLLLMTSGNNTWLLPRAGYAPEGW